MRKAPPSSLTTTERRREEDGGREQKRIGDELRVEQCPKSSLVHGSSITGRQWVRETMRWSGTRG